MCTLVIQINPESDQASRFNLGKSTEERTICWTTCYILNNRCEKKIIGLSSAECSSWGALQDKTIQFLWQIYCEVDGGRWKGTQGLTRLLRVTISNCNIWNLSECWFEETFKNDIYKTVGNSNTAYYFWSVMAVTRLSIFVNIHRTVHQVEWIFLFINFFEALN